MLEVVETSVFLPRTVFLFLIVILFSWLLYKKSRLDGIPGPWSMPVLGSLPFLGTMQLHAVLTEMRQKYGDIFQITIGSEKAVVLGGLDTVHEALVKQSHAFSGRPGLHTFSMASEGKTMVFNSPDAQWKVHRQIAEKALFMASSLEPMRLEQVVSREAEHLVQALIEKSELSPRGVYPEETVLWAVAHVQYTLCYGESRSDADFEAVVRTTLSLINCHQKGNVVNFFPWTKFILPGVYNETKRICERLLMLTRRKEDQHLASFRFDSCRDAIDALIRLSSREDCPLEKDRVLHTVQEYICAGLDIVYVALTWAALYLVKYEETQEKVRCEVDRVVGRQRAVREDDLEHMPYTKAFIFELLRHSSVVPFAIPHCTQEAATLKGFHIPKDTLVLINLFSISRDSTVWTDPESFRPERFLAADDSIEVQHAKNYFYPWGLGKRRCIGEKVSRTEIFIFIATLIQRTTLTRPKDVQHYDLTPEFGVILRPKHFRVHVDPRC